MYKYYFHIIDREYDDEYNFEGFFFDHMEADRFIAENESVGNTVIILAPFIQFVPLTECPNEYQ